MYVTHIWLPRRRFHKRVLGTNGPSYIAVIIYIWVAFVAEHSSSYCREKDPICVHCHLPTLQCHFYIWSVVVWQLERIREGHRIIFSLDDFGDCLQNKVSFRRGLDRIGLFFAVVFQSVGIRFLLLCWYNFQFIIRVMRCTCLQNNLKGAQ